jgi:sulfite reductase alpha subunit-like flavoprotein
MPEDVMEAFHLIFIKFGGLLEEEAKLKFKSLEKSKRFQQECWS